MIPGALSALALAISTLSSNGIALTIASNTANYNIHNAAIAAGWNGTSPINVTVTINSGVWVYSSTTAVAALSTGSFPAGSVLTVVNNGNIAGMGGAGGNGANGSSVQNGAAGQPGGPAVSLTYALTIVNNGYVRGGGGGGGGGAGYTGNDEGGGGGGGGQGFNGGSFGIGGDVAFNGTAGTLSGVGIGGQGGGTYGAAGGAGGTWGNPGIAASGSSQGGLGGVGGAAGKAVALNGYSLTWGGTIGNNSAYVKGAVS